MRPFPSEAEFLSKLTNEYPAAESALKNLVEDGCPKDVIARQLFLYCGGKPESVESWRKEALYWQEKMLHASRQIHEAARLVSETYPRFADFGIKPHVPKFDELPDQSAH